MAELAPQQASERFMAGSLARSLTGEARKPVAFDVNAFLKAIPKGERLWDHVRRMENDAEREAVEAELKRRKLWGRSQLMAERVQAEMAGSPVIVFLTRTYAGRVPSPKKVEADRRAMLRKLRKNIAFGVNGRRVAAGLAKLTAKEAPVIRTFSLDEYGDIGNRQHIHSMVFCGDEVIADKTSGAGVKRALADFVFEYDRKGQKIPLLTKDGKPRLDKRGQPLFKLLWPKGHYDQKRIVIPENGELDDEARRAAKYLCGYLENENSRKKASVSPPIGYVEPLPGRQAVKSPYYEKWCATQAAKHGDKVVSPVVNASLSRQRRKDERDKRAFTAPIVGAGVKASIKKSFVPVGLHEKDFVHQWLKAVQAGHAAPSIANEAIRKFTFERRHSRAKAPVQLALPDFVQDKPEKPKVDYRAVARAFAFRKEAIRVRDWFSRDPKAAARAMAAVVEKEKAYGNADDPPF